MHAESFTGGDSQWQRVAELADVGVWEWDLVQHTLSASPAWKRLREIDRDSPDDLLGESLQRVHPDDRHELESQRAKLVQGRADHFSFDYRMKTERGSWIWVEERSRAVRNGDGLVVKLIGCEMEITERKRLEQQHERLVAILEATSDYVGIASPQREILWHNKRLAQLRPDLSDPNHPADFAIAHPAWSLKIMEEVAIPTAVEKGIWSGEMAIYDMDGKEIPVSQVLIAHKGADGEIEALSTVMRDISAQKVAEQTLRDSEHRISRLLESLPVGVFRATKPNECKFVNETWRRLAGCSAEAASRGEWQELLHPDDLSEFSARIRDFRQDEESVVFKPYSFRSRKPDGSYQWLQAQATKEFDEAGNFVGVIGTWSDISNLKEAENALRESERMFSSLAASAPVAIFRMSDPEHCSYVNERWGELTQRPVEAALGKGWMAFVHPDDLSRLSVEVAEFAADTHRIIQAPYEVRHVLPDGTSSWVQCTLAKEMDADGNVVGYVGTLTDINQVKQAEEELRQFHERFQKVRQFSSIGVWQRNFADGKLIWDAQMHKIYGVGAAEFGGKFSDWADRLHPDDFDRMISDKSRKFLHPADAAPAEYRIVRPNGDVRHIYSNLYIETDEYGGPMRAIGINMDLTDLREAEIALQKANSRMERMTENVPGMVYQYVYHTDGSHEVLYVSPKCRELYEVEPEDVLNNADLLFDRIHPDDSERVKAAVRDCSETLRPFKEEFRVVLPQQQLCWRQAIGQPSRNDAGDTVWDGVAIDITQRKESELKLQQVYDELTHATKMKDRFLANMSHELRTPLSAILGMTEGLLDQVFGDLTERQRDSLQMIEQSGAHLLQLINGVLDLAKIESGKMELQFGTVNVLRLCESSLRVVSQQAATKDIELRLNVRWNMPTIEADETRLRQVLINLLSNAIKFSPDGGQVTMELQRFEPIVEDAPAWLQVSVSDTGIGIEESDFGSLFQPFVQLDNSLSRKYDGTGLGLALVKQLVELHGGQVSVSSEVSVGSCFSVEIPFEQGDRSTQPDAETPSPSDAEESEQTEFQSRRANVLLVEDNASVAESVVAYLSSSGFEVEVASDGLSAIETARRRQPDIILMDIQLPQLDGLETIRRMRTLPELQQTPIIALTGRAMPHDSERCLAAGADDYLSKPYGMRDLVETIRTFLARRST